MSAAEDDKMWDSVADPLRRRRGFCPPTDEEAEALFEAEKGRPRLSREEAEKIVERLLKRSKPEDKPTVRPDEPTGRAGAIQTQQEFGSICRNPGVQDEDAKAKEQRLLQEMLDECDDEDAPTTDD